MKRLRERRHRRPVSELPNSDAASIAMPSFVNTANACQLPTMRALDVWYDKIDLQRYEDRAADPGRVEAIRKRVAQRIAAERQVFAGDLTRSSSQTTVHTHDQDEPPLDYHPTPAQARSCVGVREGIARIASPASHVRVCSTDFTSSIWRSSRRRGQFRNPVFGRMFMAADNDPLFCREGGGASVSSLMRADPYTIMASGSSRPAPDADASDALLVDTRKNRRDFYIRQLRDMKLSGSSRIGTRRHSAVRAHVRTALARAHAAPDMPR